MNTKQIQEMLIALGYDVGKTGADGIFGRNTQNAITRFQLDQEIYKYPNGTIDTITEKALRNAYFAANPHDVSVLPPVIVATPWIDEAKRFAGLKEIVGKNSNPTIIKWAKSIGGWVANYYTDDDIPWCGLFVSHCITATLPNEPIPANPLGALEWNKFGISLTSPTYGAIMTFRRPGGGHVGFYIGEDGKFYYILGGNQKNSVSITKIEKDRLSEIRWPSTIDIPKRRPVYLNSNIAISVNEA